MTVNAGQIAPDFRGKTYTGDPIDLSQMRGTKVWLAFHRWAHCPLCNLRIKEVIDRYAEIEKKGIRLVAVFQSTPERIADGVGRQKPPFPIVSDPELSLYDAYGVRPSVAGMFYLRVFGRAIRAMREGFFSLKMEGPKAMIPADFLVDPEGVVWKAYYGSAVSDHIPFEDIDAFGEDLCLDMPEQIRA